MSVEVHARTVAALTFVSRVTGLARDATLSRTFGAGGVMDAFFFAFMIPNLFRRLFGEGALAAAFLPTYARLAHRRPAAAAALASLVTGAVIVGLGALVLVAELLLWALGDRENLAVRLAMIMLPYTPLVCAVAILGAVLQVHGRFGPTAAAPIVLNLCIITGAVAGGAVVFAAIAVLVAGVLQVGWSLLALRRVPWWTTAWRRGRLLVRRVAALAGPMILGLGVLQLNTFLDGFIASYPEAVGPTILGVPYPLERGAMSAVSYAQRLYQFPLGVFGIAVATAIFPALSRLARDHEAFVDTLQRGLRLVVFIGVPASAGLILVRGPLVAVILQGGAFGAENTAAVGRVLLGYATGVWAYSATHVLTRAYYARSDARTPVRVAVGMVSLNLLLNVTLIWTPLREAALAWSTAGCAMIQVAVLLRRLPGRVVDAAVTRSWARTAVATAVMAAAVIGCRRLLPEAVTWSGHLGELAALVGAGGATFLGAALVLGMEEWRWVAGRRG